MIGARRAILAVAVAAGCQPPPRAVERIATPAVGVSLALYREGETSYGVVDDRRWVDVRGTTLVLDNIDPGAALPSLVIEPLGGTTLAVGQCAREHVMPLPGPEPLTEADELDQDAPPPPPPVPIVVPSLRCTVTGSDGRHLVRVLYVSPKLGYRAQHDVSMTVGDRAIIATKFAIETPLWSVPADVTLFRGLPGGERSPDAIGRGSIKLDGSTAVLAATPREVSAVLRWIYDGAIRSASSVDNDSLWGRDSVRAVWVWLELEERELPEGAVHAHVAAPGEPIRDIHVPAGGREQLGSTLRLPLWIDDSMHGLRNRVVSGADGASLADRFMITVANTGERSREVWVEERLRTSKRRTLRTGWPTAPSIVHGRARTQLVIKPGTTERTGFVIEYVF